MQYKFKLMNSFSVFMFLKYQLIDQKYTQTIIKHKTIRGFRHSIFVLFNLNHIWMTFDYKQNANSLSKSK
jgi:hypothetical protein